MKRSIAFVVLLAACSDDLTPPRVVQLLHDEAVPSADGGPRPHVVPPPKCEGRCCPAASACYPAGNPSEYSGAECLAQRDNTGKPRWQLRQTSSISVSPAGIAQSQIANIIVHRSELGWPECNARLGTSGFIQLVEFDAEHDTARVGFARYAPDTNVALSEGLCFVEGSYDDPEWDLDALYAPGPEWPRGLPAPMSLPWDVRVLPAFRYRNDQGELADFDVKKDREKLLALFDPDGGSLYGKYNGIFYLDEETGRMHGYAPVTYILNYDTATHLNAIPIREAEIRTQLNDPAHPNCAGSFLGDNPDLPRDCTGDSTNRAWGCPPGNCAPEELAPTSVKGYFLLAELEQIHNFVLGRTLCSVFAADGYPGWEATQTCRDDFKWDATDPVSHMPPGDWCAATNSARTDTCHDAWRSVSYSTFQAFPIQEGTCAL